MFFLLRVLWYFVREYPWDQSRFILLLDIVLKRMDTSLRLVELRKSCKSRHHSPSTPTSSHASISTPTLLNNTSPVSGRVFLIKDRRPKQSRPYHNLRSLE